LRNNGNESSSKIDMKRFKKGSRMAANWLGLKLSEPVCK
jgi:hypothetical protein